MTANEFTQRGAALDRDAQAAIRSAASLEELERVRTGFLGRKNGQLTELQKLIPSLAADDRRQGGASFNAVKQSIESALELRRAELSASTPAAARTDLSMPARTTWRGAKHPVTHVIEEIEEIFRELGFTVASGPEVENEWYNFRALNFPANHPAMDMHDTLYLRDDVLLRTHTSPVQNRTLQSYRPPIRVIIPGNAYRRDFFDASHAPMFAQIEGLAIDEGTSFVDLKATLSHFARRFFGPTRTRFRPSFFPFTEPSAEMDVQCRICGGSGCPSCKGSGWMEILGSGMVHPAVLEASGVDSEKYSGWAFGMGPARIAQQRFGIPDIRTLYDSDVRFLEQFAE
jgi:phenylalanyl-tRNA synthetase alpha chain